MASLKPPNQLQASPGEDRNQGRARTEFWASCASSQVSRWPAVIGAKGREVMTGGLVGQGTSNHFCGEVMGRKPARAGPALHLRDQAVPVRHGPTREASLGISGPPAAVRSWPSRNSPLWEGKREFSRTNPSPRPCRSIKQLTATRGSRRPAPPPRAALSLHVCHFQTWSSLPNALGGRKEA